MKRNTATTRRHPVYRMSIGLAAVLTSVSMVGCGRTSGTGHLSAPVSSNTRPSTTAPTTHAGRGLPRSRPTWVDIPAIAARSSLVQLGLNRDRSVQVPPVSEPLQAGWYEYGPTPGEIGPAVILGHIDGDHQEGIFWRLHEMKRGDKVRIGRQDGRIITFTVRKVDEVAKTAFPSKAVYGDTSNPQLRLITCGGAFDAATRNYLDNIIVYATMTG
jgi:LPXTG-site transpeptidase (sortase) family protein